MDDDFASQLNLARAIAAEIDSLTVEFGPDAASRVAERRKQALAELTQAPRFQSIAREVYKDRIALRQQRVDVARKAASNGVTENLGLLDERHWSGRVLDFFIAELKPNEKLIAVDWWKLTTNLRVRTYHELKAGCREMSESIDAYFERNFESDATRRAAEAAEAERANPPAPRYGRNLDFPNGIRPGR